MTTRIIKFRAYDSATGKVSEPFDVKESWGDYLIDFEDYSADGALDSIIWEQFTGLLDRNGKEIYEGDIVNLEYYEKPFGKKRWVKIYPRKDCKDINVVVFEDGNFKFYKEDKDGYGSELPFFDYGEWEGKDGAYKYVAEVIGNVHESNMEEICQKEASNTTENGIKFTRIQN